MWLKKLKFMLKYVSSIILACSCIATVANAQQSYSFDFKRLNSGESLNEAPWYLPSSHFVNGNTYSYNVKNIEGANATLSMTWNGASMAKGGNDRTQFTADANKSSTLTFDFGGMTVDEVTFTLYGLESTNGSIGGLFSIVGVNKDDVRTKVRLAGTAVDNNFADLQEVTVPAGYGDDLAYQRTTPQNENASRVAIVTIYAPMTSLQLYFESQAYTISSLTFNAIPQAPEPATYAALLGLGVAGVAIIRRRRKA